MPRKQLEYLNLSTLNQHLSQPYDKVYELNTLLTTVGRLAAAQLSRGAVCPTVPLHYSCSAECSVCSAQSQLAH